MENKIKQEFIKLLHKTYNHRLDFNSIIVSLKYIFEKDNINDEQIIKIKDDLIAENIINKEIIIGDLFITLNNIGFEIIQNHKTYSNYLEHKKKVKKWLALDKILMYILITATLIYTILSYFK
jgi:hypothetical protein